MNRYDVNDRLTALAQEAGVDTSAEGVDETLNELTHIVADALGISMREDEDDGLDPDNLTGMDLGEGVDRCAECGTNLAVERIGGTILCSACLHDALRSGWEPGGDQ